MGLYEDLIQQVYQKASREIAKDVRVGNTWTAVKTSKSGLSLTYSSPFEDIEEAGTLTDRPASELLEFLRTFNFLKVGVGLATLNSLLDTPSEHEIFNILDYLKEAGAGKRIVFVGHFCGLEEIRSSASELLILERNPQMGDFPDTASEYIIPQADIVAITGSSITNKSIERLLQLSKGLTIVFGPSTPLTSILFDYGAHIIGGSIIENEDFVLKAVSEGAHLSNFKKHLKYVVMRKK